MSVSVSANLKKDTIVINNNNSLSHAAQVSYPPKEEENPYQEMKEASQKQQYYEALEEITAGQPLKIYPVDELVKIIRLCISSVVDVDVQIDSEESLCDCGCRGSSSDCFKINNIIIIDIDGVASDLKIKYNSLYRWLIQHGVDLKHVQLPQE